MVGRFVGAVRRVAEQVDDELSSASAPSLTSAGGSA